MEVPVCEALNATLSVQYHEHACSAFDFIRVSVGLMLSDSFHAVMLVRGCAEAYDVLYYTMLVIVALQACWKC